MNNFSIKRVFFLSTLMFCAWAAKAQVADTPEVPNITPPSPTAYELGKYGQIDVGMFTGTPNINVPLYTYNTKNLSLPISLSYSSNGIKVDQMSTWVGLGWSLNAGGVITRVIRDLPDERFGVTEPPRELTQSNQLDTDIQDFAIVAESPVIDTERDMFMFNFNGYSGRFTILDNQVVVVAPSQALEVTYTNLADASSSFEITTADGIKYFFSDQEKSNATGGCVPSDALYPITAWYLTKITHPFGDEINFVYVNENYSYEVGITQSFSINKSLLGDGCFEQSGPQCPDLTAATPCINYSSIQGKRLVEINSDNPINGKLVFTSGIRNPDIPTGPSFGDQYLLDTIELLDKGNTVVERYTLNYQIEKKRSFLNSVVFLDPSKKYEFEYFSPSLLADRLDYGQDYWGYYNGRNNTVFYPRILEEPLLANYGAIREPNSTFAQYGLLRKLTYPTKGTTELEYEPNIAQQTNTIVYDTENLSFQLENATESFYFTTSNNTAPQIIGTINLRIFEKSDTPCLGITDFFEDTPFNTIWLSATLFDVTAGSPVAFLNSGSSLLQTNQPYVPLEGTFNLQAGHEYRLDLEKGNTCIYGIANINYTTSSISQELIDKEIGGLRIKKRINKANPTDQGEILRYFYGDMNNLNSSSASEATRGYYVNDKTIQLLCPNPIVPSPHNCEYLQVNSSSVIPLYTTNNNKPVYEYVTISHGGDNFENGGEQNRYMVHEDAKGETVFSRYAYIPDNSTFSNTGWSNGLLKSRTVFKNGPVDDFIVLDQTENFYKNDTRNYRQIINYKVIKRHDITVWYNDDYPTDQIDIIKYRDNSYWHYLDSTITRKYDVNGQNPIVEITKNHYDNPTHLQLTSTERTNSKNEEITTNTFFPDDKLLLTNLSAVASTAIDSLLAQHRIATPLQSTTVVRDDLNTILSTSIQRTNFRDWTGVTPVLPEYVQSNKETEASLEDRIRYHSYFDNGNIREVSKADGMQIVYLWGYDQQYPIAKIENATYAQVSALVANLETKSNEDVDRTIDTFDGSGNRIYNGEEGELRQALDALRDSLPGAMVTTYTYDPLIGVTSITDPRGYTIYYSYDSFNRLKEVRDQDNNLVTDYEYHYKG
ncbi:RHS repeat domain-containing protein [Ulvibacterium sp.]|uniref:RHS repeat domain-containing protein n=1 Tax=Ulvibacterium sp. TaxID=2665914 RepID=UPI002639E904|nr:RHS repeat domain-containing protein [Ulvibacterium sp.]